MTEFCTVYTCAQSKPFKEYGTALIEILIAKILYVIALAIWDKGTTWCHLIYEYLFSLEYKWLNIKIIIEFIFLLIESLKNKQEIIKLLNK